MTDRMVRLLIGSSPIAVKPPGASVEPGRLTGTASSTGGELGVTTSGVLSSMGLPFCSSLMPRSTTLDCTAEDSKEVAEPRTVRIISQGKVSVEQVMV